MSVATSFETFCTNLLIGQDKRSTISTRYLSICKRLNLDFWEMDTETGGRYVGSYGRNTATNYVSDIDMLFELPFSCYSKYNSYIGNGQSALLQAVKSSISKTYPDTAMKGDGQIVQVLFSDGMQIEVLPAFKQDDGSLLFPNTNDGGSWKRTNPVPEINTLSDGDRMCNYNLRPLCRMARSWKRVNNVPIKGHLIDTLSYKFLVDWANRDKSYLYYDYMSRDFFRYLKDQNSTQTIWYAMGSGQQITNQENFRYKSGLAYDNCLKAIKQEQDGNNWSSNQTWKEIYGTRFPS